MRRWRAWLIARLQQRAVTSRSSSSHHVPSLRGFEGEWVAIRDGEVVEARDSPYELVARLRQRQVEDAAIMRAPAENEPEMVGFG